MKTKIDIYLEESQIKKLEEESHKIGITISQILSNLVEEKYKSIITKKEVKQV